MRARITIGGMLAVDGLPESVEQALVAANTFPNPEYQRRQKLGLSVHDTARNIELWKRSLTGLILPRGAFPIVVARCRKADVRFEIVNETVAPPLGVEIAIAGELYPYQRRAVDTLLGYDTGILEGLTGCGKTNILLSTIPEMGTTALILVHTKELFRQTRERCAQWLGYEPGALGAGEWDLKPISVAMIQTLARRDLDDLGDYFGAVLVDEAHHSPAKTWASICNQMRAKYRYGFTATAWRADGLTKLMHRTIGSVSVKVERAEVEALGKVVAPDVETIETSFYYELEDTSQWGQMIGALVEDAERNDLIEQQVRDRMVDGTRALILSDRIAHVEILAERLADFDPVVLVGSLPQRDRDAGMAAVRNGAALTIATSSLLGEGVDVPGWDLLVMATPAAGGPRTLQMVGRVTRAAPGKDRAVVVDLVDMRVPALVGAWRKRERVYAAA